MSTPPVNGAMRLLPAGDAVLVELADLSQTLALLASLQADPIPGVKEIVPGARTLLLILDSERVLREGGLDEGGDRRSVGQAERHPEGPLQAPPEGLAQTWAPSLAVALVGRSLVPVERAAGACVEIPVHYDGEDLAEVAALLQITPQDVVRRHTGSDWFVAFTGFAPGFAYLTGGDELLRTLPRRSSPRTRIPAGAVAAAGGFSGIYPKASPGGWQLLGQTLTPMWDVQRDPPALLQPGQRVRFVDAGARGALAGHGEVGQPGIAPRDITAVDIARTQGARADGPAVPHDVEPAAIEIAQPGLQALLQDLGRPGQAGQGVSASGAMDRRSLKAANRLVGNPEDEACMEAVLGGFELISHGDVVVAVTGAQGPLQRIGPDGRSHSLDRHTPLALSRGDRLRLGAPSAGIRSYVSVRGGVAIPAVLGSRSYDSLADVGPAPLKAGDRLRIRPLRQAAVVGHPEAAWTSFPRPGDDVPIDLCLGPRADWFTQEALTTLVSQPWTVTPHSNRVGLRLQGDTALSRAVTAELPSEGTPLGALQVPANGQPVLFLADHPLTGGYPVIACVAPWHLDLAGQLPVGVRLRFRVVRGFEPLTVPA